MTRPYKGRSSTALPDTSWVWTEISLRPRAAQAALLQACVVPALRKLREGQGTRRVGHASKIKNLGHPPYERIPFAQPWKSGPSRAA